jgi:hypothetical protein
MGKFFPFLFGQKKRNHADHDRPCRKFKQKKQYFGYGNQGQKQGAGQQVPFVEYLFHKNPPEIRVICNGIHVSPSNPEGGVRIR